ncbi:MAG TPA: metallophosphoesterase [Longimicrobiales bacterium]
MRLRLPAHVLAAGALAAAALHPAEATAQNEPGRMARSDSATRGFVEITVTYPYSFAVLGHIRGGRDGTVNYLLNDVIDEASALRPDFIVLTGDIIWGEVQTVPTDANVVHAQWARVDSALAALGVPVYRVPGNHDINDVTTRRVYEERYGPPNRTVDLGDARLILLASGFMPEPGDERKHAFIRGIQPDSVRITWLRSQLDASRSDSASTFLFMHHLLWWEDRNAPWWRDVHPLLARDGVKAVFTGDYGPLKFSHTRRDGIDYYQSGLTPGPANLGLLRGHEWNRLLAAQFDSFLFVTVASADSVVIDVHTVGETASGDFTPELFREVHGGIDRPGAPGGRERLAALWANPRGRLFLVGVPVIALLAGLGLGAVLTVRFRQS